MKTVYNKLVRDNIPEIIASEHGATVTFRKLTGDAEYLAALHEKLDEEVAEYHKTHDPEELADIMEVINALMLAMTDKEKSIHHVDIVRVNKRAKRGGFDKRYFLEEVIDDQT